MSALNFTWKRFADFDAASLYNLMRLRQDVFIVEQQSIYPDLDGLDPVCRHLVVTDGAGALAGCLRARQAQGDEPAFIGRIVVGAAGRGTGLGRRLVAAGLDHMDEHFPGQPIRIGAQLHLARFYESFGFVVDGAPYDDGGIPHVGMWRR